MPASASRPMTVPPARLKPAAIATELRTPKRGNSLRHTKVPDKYARHIENIVRPYWVLLRPRTLMKINDDEARKVNSPPYDAAASAEKAKNSGLPMTVCQVRTRVAGRSALGFLWLRLSLYRSAINTKDAAPNNAGAASAASDGRYKSRTMARAHGCALYDAPANQRRHRRSERAANRCQLVGGQPPQQNRPVAKTV